MLLRSSPRGAYPYFFSSFIAQDYYPFGMLMPGRIYTASDQEYRYGFQGQEEDNEVKGKGNSIDYKYRVHDPRIGRFFSVDPLTAKYPFYSPYAFSGNRVIDMVELEGLEPEFSGSYGGQGVVAPVTDGNGGWKAGTESQRWTWDGCNDQWRTASFAITNAELRKVFTNATADNLRLIESTINIKGKAFGIDSYIKVAHYLAQAGHETGGFSNTNSVESTYYKSAERVGQVFGTNSSIFKNVSKDPTKYLKNDVAFANMAYANKIGNGNEASGDGSLFRGRGFFQLTGRANYQSFTNAYNLIFSDSAPMDFVANPSLVGTDPTAAIISSMWYFSSFTVPKINKGSSFETITKTINAAAVGLEERQEIYNNAIGAFPQQ